MSLHHSRFFFALLGRPGLKSCAAAAALIFSGHAVAAPGDLYATDLTANAIYIFANDGSVQTFATGLDQPQGVVVDAGANVFVCEAGSGDLIKFTSDGTKSVLASGFANPMGISFDGFYLLVAENGADAVTRVGPDGSKTSFLTITAPRGVAAKDGNTFITHGTSLVIVASDSSRQEIELGSETRDVAVVSETVNEVLEETIFVSTESGVVYEIAPDMTIMPFPMGRTFDTPNGVAFRPARFSGDENGVGNIYVADAAAGEILEFTKVGVEDTFASVGNPNFLAFERGTGTPTPTPTPSPSPSVSPSPSPTPTPSPSPSPSASPSPSPTLSPSPSPSPSPTPTPGLLRNISTRDNVLTGDKVLIGGFIVTGGTTGKTVVIRGIGPSLSGANPPVMGVLANPVLELHMPDGSVITNDDWKDNSALDQAALVASGLAPTNDLESALIVTLPPEDPSVSGSGLYTAIVRGHDDTTGIGLMEVYDLDDPLTTTSELANISTRGFVSTGDSALIGGFITGPGSDDGAVLTRAIGPALGEVGVADPLQDPTLELFDGNGNSIAFNDNWQDNANGGAEILGTGLAPTNESESAILSALVAGNYTVIMRGVNDTSGVALVEAYHLENSTPAH